MNIFSDRTGRSILVPDVGFPFSIMLEDWGGPNALNAVITSFGLVASGNFQFMHTLRNFVYVYVFGDRISEINVAGLAVASRCENDMPSGIELLWEYYQRKKISANGTPINIVIGTRMLFQGFLTGFNFSCTDTNFGLSQWALRFHTHPPDGDAPRVGNISNFIPQIDPNPLQPILPTLFGLGGTLTPSATTDLFAPTDQPLAPSQRLAPIETQPLAPLN